MLNTRNLFLAKLPGRSPLFTPRIKMLQELNGQIFPSVAGVKKEIVAPGSYQGWEYINWLFAANKLNLSDCILKGKVGEVNLGKWLKHSHVPEALISQVCAAKIPQADFVLTTRYRDLVRMADSKHYDSCIKNSKIGSLNYYLHKKNVFMLVVRDARGDFSSRVIGRVTRVTNWFDAGHLGLPMLSKIIIFNRVYGVDLIPPSSLAGIPCFAQNWEECTGLYATKDLVCWEVGDDEKHEKLGENPCQYSNTWDDLGNYPIFRLTSKN